MKCRSRCGESVLESQGFIFGCTEWLLGAGRSREERGLTAGPGPALPAHPGSSLGRFMPVETLCHSLHSHWPRASCPVAVQGTCEEPGAEVVFVLGTQKS